MQEVVAIKALREGIGSSKSADVVWRQLRSGFSLACRSRAFELLVDLHLLRSSWVTDDEVIVNGARAGHPVRVLDLGRPIGEAEEGFRLAARPVKTGR